MSPSQLDRKAATAVLILGGLLVGACGAHAADAAPTASAQSGVQAHAETCASPMDERHATMLPAMAQALGMTVEELQTEMNAGKRPPQIAHERGVDFSKVRETMRAAHGERSHDRARGGRGAMKGHGGMMGHAGDCPMMQARVAEPPGGDDQK